MFSCGVGLLTLFVLISSLGSAHATPASVQLMPYATHQTQAPCACDGSVLYALWHERNISVANVHFFQADQSDWQPAVKQPNCVSQVQFVCTDWVIWNFFLTFGLNLGQENSCHSQKSMRQAWCRRFCSSLARSMRESFWGSSAWTWLKCWKTATGLCTKGSTRCVREPAPAEWKCVAGCGACCLLGTEEARQVDKQLPKWLVGMNFHVLAGSRVEGWHDWVFSSSKTMPGYAKFSSGLKPLRGHF